MVTSLLALPEPIAAACAPLFEAVPLDTAMAHLTGNFPSHTELVEGILKNPALAHRKDLEAGLWLYVDDLERSHSVSQSLPDSIGAYWHGIMHRREGDFSNSHYWLRRVLDKPLQQILAEQDSYGLTDAVARVSREVPDLTARQRNEWKVLFEWCAARP